MGWGQGPWGLNQWGGGGQADLRLESARAIRDNVVRLFFNAPPLFTGILDPSDASNPDRYQILAVPGTGAEGTDPRTVSIVEAAIADVEGAGGSAIDVTLDRPMSGFPAQYTIVVNQLVVAGTGGPLEAGFTSFTFPALAAFAPPPARDQLIPSRDIANPQTLEATQQPLMLTELGGIVVDERGDYAFDQGVVNLKKRIFRRLVTGKGRFNHLPEYGVGLLEQLKKLSLQGNRREIAEDARAQISREPEVEDVSVEVVNDAQEPSLLRLRVRVRASKLSSEAIDMDIPFSPTEA